MSEVEPHDDGLIIPTVGPWAKQKHHFLRRYLNAFTRSMRGKWPSLHYVDPFASAGLARIRSTNELIWGSPLIAAQLHVQFDRLHLCEIKPELFNALSTRVGRFSQPQAPQLIHDDANKALRAMIDSIPPGSLSVVFLDPHGLLDFNTVVMTARRRTDLIIFFPDYLDAVRNLERYRDAPTSKLSRFLGTHDWVKEVEEHPWEHRIEIITTIYKRQLESLGYKEVEFERVYMKAKSRLYRLVFASEHSFAATLWRKTSQTEQSGQRSFGFDD